MARKDTLQYQISNAQSLAATFSTTPTFVRNGDNLSYQINVTTTNSTGTYAVEVSDDYRISEPTNAVLVAGNWIALTLGGGTPTVSAVNDFINISLNQLPAGAIRITYTAGTAGTGTCNIFLTMKQVGG